MIKLNHDRKILRKKLREERRSLTPDEQDLAGKNLLNQLLRQPALWRSQHIALYLTMAKDGELDTSYVIQWCRAHDKQLYLPVLRTSKPGYMWFLLWNSDTPLTLNRCDIPEPPIPSLIEGAKGKRFKPLWELDLVLVPLVGFDREGNRIGMGGGHYDRTFAFTRTKRSSRIPKLVGVGHSCQETRQLPVASWDIPLDGICTDSAYIDCSRR